MISLNFLLQQLLSISFENGVHARTCPDGNLHMISNVMTETLDRKYHVKGLIAWKKIENVCQNNRINVSSEMISNARNFRND